MTENQHTDQLIAHALKLQANHELDLAINLYQKVLAIDSKNWIAVCNLGVLHSKKGAFGEAIRLISRIKLSHPNSASFIDAYRELGVSLYLKGYKNQSLEWLNLVVELNPDDLAVKKLVEELATPQYLKAYAHDSAQGKWLKRYSPYEKNNYIYAIDIVGTCNLRCPSCPVGNMPNEPRAKGFMTLELFQEILQKIKMESPVVNPEIWLFNWGEPLLHPKIREIIEVVRSYGWAVVVSTNLNVKRGLEDLAISAPTSIKISISGVTDKNYSITHERGDIKLVKENLVLLKKYIEQHQSHLGQEKKTNVYLGYHLYKDNLDEAVVAANLAKELGFGYAENPAIIQPVEKMMAILENNPTSVDENLINRLLVHPKLLTKNISSKRSGTYDCELRFNMTSINHDGSVGLCCSTYSNANQIAPDFMKISHQELESMKYSNDFCKKCSNMSLNYSLCDVVSD